MVHVLVALLLVGATSGAIASSRATETLNGRVGVKKFQEISVCGMMLPPPVVLQLRGGTRGSSSGRGYGRGRKSSRGDESV